MEIELNRQKQLNRRLNEVEIELNQQKQLNKSLNTIVCGNKQDILNLTHLVDKLISEATRHLSQSEKKYSIFHTYYGHD